jgi:uncharacterized membrane protein YdbT with pleckstrin-like domain
MLQSDVHYNGLHRKDCFQQFFVAHLSVAAITWCVPSHCFACLQSCSLARAVFAGVTVLAFSRHATISYNRNSNRLLPQSRRVQEHNNIVSTQGISLPLIMWSFRTTNTAISLHYLLLNHFNSDHVLTICFPGIAFNSTLKFPTSW